MKKDYLMTFLCCVLLTIITTVRSEAIGGKQIPIGLFSLGTMTGWQSEVFEGETLYTLVKGKDKQVLMADSESTASGMVYKQQIDLEQTPWLNWSWKTESVLTGLDETKKTGDDFTARLYVIVDGGLLFWQTHALNYVWSSSHGKGEKWPNPYTSNATMFAVEAGETALGEWQHYSRNVRSDLKHLVGKDIRYIDAVAIMTDTDNSRQKAKAYYGDIFFTDKKQEPVMERDDEIN